MYHDRFSFVVVTAVALVVLVASGIQAGPPQPPIITSGEFILGDFDGDDVVDEAKIDWVTFHVTARTTVNFDALIIESKYSTGDINGDGEITQADGGMVLFDKFGNILVVHDDAPAGVLGNDGSITRYDGNFDFTFEKEGLYTLAISANGYFLTVEDALAGYIDYRILGPAFRDQDGEDADHADWQLTLTASHGAISNVLVDTLGTPATPNPAEAAPCTYLWPPNHELVDVGISFDPTADVLVFSNEADGGDMVDAVFDEDGALWLRAERSGEGIGRVYLIVTLSANGDGSTLDCCTLVVPHDKSKSAVDSIEEEALLAETFCLLTGVAPEGYSLIASFPLP